MAENLEALFDYFQSPNATIFDYLAIFFLFFLLALAAVLAFREYRISKRTKRVVKNRYVKPVRILPSSRRGTPRLPMEAPIEATFDNEEKTTIDAQIVDISAGGARIIFFDIKRKDLSIGDIFTISHKDETLSSLDNTKAKILKISGGPRSETPVIHSKWIDMDDNAARELNREIRRSLINNL